MLPSQQKHKQQKQTLSECAIIFFPTFGLLEVDSLEVTEKIKVLQVGLMKDLIQDDVFG